ncbi:unnamed protein product [Heterobilharzia americana]|nr:unnamed protein product [Heterobilharzia americana]
MNLSAINLTNSFESSSPSSSPDLLNNGTTITCNSTTLNSPTTSNVSSTMNGDAMKLSPNYFSHHNHHTSQNHDIQPASSSSSSSAMSAGVIPMNHLSNSLFFPFPPNFLLQESFSLIYHTCLNMFEKRLNEELKQFNQKYEVLLRECTETRFRLNKLENFIQLFEEKFNSMNNLSFPAYFYPSSKSQHHQRQQDQSQQNNTNDTNLLNSLKNIESAWLCNWKDHEIFTHSAHGNISPGSLLTSMSTMLTDEQHSQTQQHTMTSLSSSKTKENLEYAVNHLSNSTNTHSSTNDQTNFQSPISHESVINQIHNSTCNLDPTLLSSLPNSNRQFMWNQWMANFMASNGSINSPNGLLSSPSSTLSSTLNTSDRINSLNTLEIEPVEGNQNKSCRLYPPVFFSNHEFNPTDLLNCSRKPSTSATSSSSSSSLRFRGNKFGRVKTKCLNSNRCQQGCTFSNNRLHLCNNKSNHFSSAVSTSTLKSIRKSVLNFQNSNWSDISSRSQMTISPPSITTSIIDQSIRSNLLNDLQLPGSNGMLLSTASNSRSSHNHNNNSNTTSSSNNNNSQTNNLIDRPVVILNPDEPREIFIGGVQSVSLPLWAYCKCLTMVRGEPHELGPRLCLRLLQSLFSLHYLVTHNYNGSGVKHQLILL